MTGRSTPLVVVGIDGSPGSQAALTWAAGYARAVGAELEAVIAWRLPADLAFGYAMAEYDGEAAAREVADKQIVEAGLAGAGARVTVVFGPPTQVLVARSHECDHLVVGSRGHGAVAGAVLGSVGLHCVMHAACPVTVVPNGPRRGR